MQSDNGTHIEGSVAKKQLIGFLTRVHKAAFTRGEKPTDLQEKVAFKTNTQMLFRPCKVSLIEMCDFPCARVL